ncbi:hypothetical protein FRC03_012539 [Tulasnella sp. 419]|nr:hypothetical protein FRC03_012539 [Tulasnella sp. 419]
MYQNGQQPQQYNVANGLSGLNVQQPQHGGRPYYSPQTHRGSYQWPPPRPVQDPGMWPH